MLISKKELKQQLQDMLEREARDLRRARRAMGQLSFVLGDFSTAKTSTWPGLIERVIGVVVDGSGVHTDIDSYMSGNDREMVAENIPIAMHHFGLSTEQDVVFKTEHVRAIECSTEAGERFWVVNYTGVEWDLYLTKEQNPAPVFEHLAKKLWGDAHGVRLDLRKSDTYGPGEVLVTPLSLSRYEYVGELSRCIEEWDKFRAAGIRRSVLLQGKPGAGKSTLCLHAARTLTERCVLISSTVYEAFSGAEWKNLLAIMSPEMLVLDDIDRVGSGILGNKLDSFEERKGADEIPFIMFTSNNIDEIPEAFRRPGRIDQILVVSEPSDVVRVKMVEEFARSVGVDVPPTHMGRLQAMIASHSGAHVIEALKRSKVLGWEHAPMSEDITFRPKKES